MDIKYNEIEDVRPNCRYSKQDLETFKNALRELSKHEENMIAFYTGFGTINDVNRARSIQYRLLESITALNDMILTEL